MKILAYYLPQFHENEKNNLWWGKGFTEWVNLKKSKSLYKNHKQPKIPLNKNYYNLLDKSTMLWQTELAKKYCLYGFCYYHYWSCGEQLLEKPLENLLKWKDIDQKFCLFWANHNWTKSWIGDKKTILFKQNYGVEKDWEKHYMYLEKFFKDERYIKVDNKPMFIIYNKEDISNYDEMILYFNKEAQKSGFNGIYIIESISNLKKLKKEFGNNKFPMLIREPECCLDERNVFEKIIYRLKIIMKKNYFYFVTRYNYKRLMLKSIKISKKFSKENIYPSVFTEWDNTPRYGRRGYVIENDDIKNFKNYILEQKKIMKEKNIEYLFINAWNEWTEGMHLEPDERNHYSFLEVIRDVVIGEKNNELE